MIDYSLLETHPFKPAHCRRTPGQAGVALDLRMPLDLGTKQVQGSRPGQRFIYFSGKQKKSSKKGARKFANQCIIYPLKRKPFMGYFRCILPGY